MHCKHLQHNQIEKHTKNRQTHFKHTNSENRSVVRGHYDAWKHLFLLQSVTCKVIKIGWVFGVNHFS